MNILEVPGLPRHPLQDKDKAPLSKKSKERNVSNSSVCTQPPSLSSDTDEYNHGEGCQVSGGAKSVADKHLTDETIVASFDLLNDSNTSSNCTPVKASVSSDSKSQPSPSCNRKNTTTSKNNNSGGGGGGASVGRFLSLSSDSDESNDTSEWDDNLLNTSLLLPSTVSRTTSLGQTNNNNNNQEEQVCRINNACYQVLTNAYPYNYTLRIQYLHVLLIAVFFGDLRGN